MKIWTPITVQTNDYYHLVEIVTFNLIIVYDLLVFDRNTLNHLTVR